jgi:chemotaxis protein MotB
MNLKKRWLFCSAVVLLAGCVSSSKYQKAQSDLNSCANAKNSCIADKQTLQGQVDTLSKQNADLTQAAQAKEAEIAQLKGTYDQLMGNLKDEIAKGEIQVTQLKDQLHLNMVEKILFDSGSTRIKESGQKVLKQIASAINQVKDKDVRVEGFTDNVPVGPKLRETYPTNWELSTARATTVVRFLQEKGGVDPGRLIAAGYGEYHAVVSNDTPEGQAENRRIDIVLVAPEIAAPAAKFQPPASVAPSTAPAQAPAQAPAPAPAVK